MAQQQSGSVSNFAAAGLVGSGITSIMSGVASYMAGDAQARQFRIQNIFLDLEAEQQKLRGREQANALRTQFLRDLGNANASFASRGISTGSGIGRQFAIQGLKTLGRDVRATELGVESAVGQTKLQQSQNVFQAKSAKNLGFMQAVGGLIGGGFNVYQGSRSLIQNNRSSNKPEIVNV